jgi:hypothetical protein
MTDVYSGRYVSPGAQGSQASDRTEESPHMSAKKMNVTENASTTTSAVATPTVLDQLKAQLVEAERAASGSEAVAAKLELAKADVAKYQAELLPFASARNRVTQLKAAIKTLEAPVTGRSFGGGVVMTDEVKRKLSETHKRLWQEKKARLAAAGQPMAVKA